MDNLKQISVKIDPRTLEKLDALTGKFYAYKRNAIINNFLTALVDNCDSYQLYNLLRYWRHNPATKLEITIKPKETRE